MYSINKSNSLSGISGRYISPFVNTVLSVCSFCIVFTSVIGSISQRISFCGRIESAQTGKRYSKVTLSGIRLSTLCCVRKSLCRQRRKILLKILIATRLFGNIFRLFFDGFSYTHILGYLQSRFRASPFPSKDE